MSSKKRRNRNNQSKIQSAEPYHFMINIWIYFYIRDDDDSILLFWCRFIHLGFPEPVLCQIYIFPFFSRLNIKKCLTLSYIISYISCYSLCPFKERPDWSLDKKFLDYFTAKFGILNDITL